MILLNTLTRYHIAFTLVAAQVIGSIGTILARATAPDKVGPGDIFPDFSGGIKSALNAADFWVCLLFMLSINAMCFMFFRKEQLQKPWMTLKVNQSFIWTFPFLLLNLFLFDIFLLYQYIFFLHVFTLLFFPFSLFFSLLHFYFIVSLTSSISFVCVHEYLEMCKIPSVIL